MASSNSPILVDDGFNEYESAPKRQKYTTSKVWDKITKLECENKNELKAQCNHCKSIFSAKSSSGTSHLRRHLNSFVSTFLVCGKHSFRTVEELGFRHMMRIATARDVLMYYAKERVDKDWKLQKRIIRFRALFPPYDGLNIADELVLCLSQWGIDKKIFSITLDNASYNNVMVSCLTNRFRANRAILCDVFFQVRCCTHILNLIVKVGLELVDDVVGRIRNGIKYIKKSGIRRKRFYDVAEKNFHLNVTKKLRQDVCVSWNSTYLMLKSSLYYKNVLDYWGQWDKDYQIFALSNEEWRNVAILCKFLKVFYDVTCVFSGSNYPTANLFFKGVWKVHKVLLDTVKCRYSFLTPMVKQMQEKFNKYWAEYSLILSYAAILDLRYKLSYVQYCFTTIYGIHASDFFETIFSNLRLLFDEYVKKSKSMSSSLAESSNVSDKNPVDSSLDEHNVNSVDFRGDFDESDDYKRFLNESSTKKLELELNSQIDVLDYWSKSLVRYNELSLLARDLLAIPISTVASESAFSMDKKVITPLRSSLKPKTVQAVVCLDDWMRPKGFSTGNYYSRFIVVFGVVGDVVFTVVFLCYLL
ncbi:hypothetical protein ES319_A11G257300v1 [Gossypium barbadense]|uniref:BED-type domain-containing protein n=1 Tax=Gossypium barbadense TaxID=3634 RepID=A0A5J5TVJ4_GOSBA|nr:hypothetical protein ES319_A11G257300v1 [Gossypium barbadense]